MNRLAAEHHQAERVSKASLQREQMLLRRWRRAGEQPSHLSDRALEVLSEFVEVETGKGSDALSRRPRLAEALATARKAKAPVVVASPAPAVSPPGC